MKFPVLWSGLVSRVGASLRVNLMQLSPLDRNAQEKLLCHTFPTNVSDSLKTVFSLLKYPKHLVNSIIKSFVDSKVCDKQQPLSPFKDQISADIVRKQLKDLSLKVHTTIQPVFVSRKIEQELSVKERQSHRL